MQKKFLIIYYLCKTYGILSETKYMHRLSYTWERPIN